MEINTKTNTISSAHGLPNEMSIAFYMALVNGHTNIVEYFFSKPFLSTDDYVEIMALFLKNGNDQKSSAFKLLCDHLV